MEKFVSTSRLLGLMIRIGVTCNWLVISAVLISSSITRQNALIAFAIFRMATVLLIFTYTIELFFAKRAGRFGPQHILDGMSVLSLFVFWFFVRAANF